MSEIRMLSLRSGLIRNSFIAILATVAFLSLSGRAYSAPIDAQLASMSSRVAGIEIPFMSNDGQLDDEVSYYARTFSGEVFVTRKGQIVYSILSSPNPKGYQPESADRGTNRQEPGSQRLCLRENVVGGQLSGVTGEMGGTTRISFFQGKDPSKWKSDIPAWQIVSLGEIYPGVALKLRAYGNNVEKLFFVKPSGKTEDIVLEIQGGDKLKTTDKGELEIETALGTVRFTKPVAYQVEGNEKRYVDVSYTVSGNQYGFSVSAYDRSRELVIDPLLASTFLGGSGSDDALGRSITTDSEGNVYVTGGTYSSNFPVTTGVFDTSHNGNNDVFVAKFDSSLQHLLASTFIGGSGTDQYGGYCEYGCDIVIDPEGNVYVGGNTNSSNFPVTSGAYDRSFGGGVHDAFILKMDNNLTTLLASTYFGDANYERTNGMALDSSGNLFVNIPTSGDPRVLKFNNTLTTLLASVTWGGSSSSYEANYALCLDVHDHVYVTGSATSSNFPITAGCYDSTHNGGRDVFVSKYDNGLTTLLASTFIGGSGDDYGECIKVDADGNVVVGGKCSAGFPTVAGGYDTTHNGGSDCFIAKLDASFENLVACTLFGGSSNDSISGLEVDANSHVLAVGHTESSDFPTSPGAYDTVFNGTHDAYIVKMDASLGNLLSGTFLGGSGLDAARGIAIDSDQAVFVAGCTNSSDFPTTTGAYDATFNGGTYDAFVTKLSFAGIAAVTTAAVSAITATSASGGGDVTSDGGYSVTARGVCWSTSSNPTVSGSKTTDGSGTGSFTSSITGLSPNTTYHVRAYATNSEGTAYGSDVSFTTSVIAPTATTNGATSVTSSSAALNGTVNPNGASTTVTFEYGTTTSYGSTVTASQSPLSGTTSQAVSAGITGLTPGTTYHFRVRATNSAGTADGSDVSFTASADAPTISTSAANPVGSSSATLNGTVNPNGSSTAVTFEYGATTGYGSTVTAAQSPLTGTSAQSVSAGISGLNANATYHFRVRATNSAGTTDGSDQAFTTASVVPTVATGSASSVDSESAMLNGTIDPNGLSTTYYFEYGSTTNYGTISGIRSAGSGWGAGDVSAYIAGLKPGATYHYRLVGNNSVGTSDGADKTFTTSAPPATAPTVTTGWATSVTGSSAKLNGTINPNGAAATYYFQYGTSTSYGSTTTSTSAGAGTSDVSVNAAVTDLLANTTYHFRLVGNNSAGATYGSDQSFTTGTTAKAIIVAGGGPYAGNNIWDVTQMIASYACKALLYQGYTKDTLYYLSSNTSHDVDGDGNSDVDAAATLANLQSAITSWASDASDLFLYMIDHGGAGNFRLSPGETLLATDLDAWLDNVQNSGVAKVIVLYDACHSGSFLPLLGPPSGKTRILATSAASAENSLFSVRGTLSFSYLFWSHMFNGDSFYNAFVDAANSVKLAYPNRMQPQVEGNWNGTGNEKDDKTLASQVEIGSGILSASGLPTIESVSPPQTVYVGTSALIYAKNVVAIAGVSRVWAVITPPDYSTSDDPVTDLPVCDMSQGSGQWEGAYGDFTTDGTYNIAVFVEDKDGFLSLPVQTVVNAISAATTTTTTTTTSTTTTTTTSSTTTTTLPKPTVLTGAVSGPGTDSATLRGTVNPNGIATSYYFQYGRTGSYEAATTSTSIGAGTSEIAVTESISGLQPGAEYHYRLVGTSNGGTSYGSDQGFKTGYASVVFVHPTDTACGGNSPCCTSIQNAINTAETGYEIRISGGTYSESFELNEAKLLTLSGRWNDGFSGQTGAATVIKAPKAPQGSLTLQNVNIVP